VRYPDFPTVVAATSGTVVDLFDGTQQFDHNMFVCVRFILYSCSLVVRSVTQYLDGTTQDPLIVLNQTMASDLRVFSSDNNATMQRWVVFIIRCVRGDLWSWAACRRQIRLRRRVRRYSTRC
jgi:hypothetical protein